jgi:hypothetical protein
MISDQKQWPKNDSPEKNPFVKNCQNMIAFKKKKKKKKKKILKKGYTNRKKKIFQLKEKTFIIILCIREFYSNL